jgi:hypothetical protein
MSNTAPIYSSACRFTDKAVTVAHNGHGIRISLDAGEFDVSRFLNQEQTLDLVEALLAKFSPRLQPASTPPRCFSAREEMENLRLALRGFLGRLNRLETAVFTNRMETHMAIMQERIGRLENARAALTETLRVV